MTPVRTLALSAAVAAVLSQGATAQEVVVTRPEIKPVDPATIIAAPVSTTPASAMAQDEPLPPNAPREDYEFVGWCAGVLTGHMALFDRVEPTLKQISKRWNTEARDERDNAEKQVAGRDLLVQFADAMRAAEKGSAAAIAPNGARAIAQGREMWAKIDLLNENDKAYSWLNWGLPGRCEITAAKLKSRATLMGAALRDNSASAIQTSAVRAVGERPDKPAPTNAGPVEPKTEAIAAVAPVAAPSQPIAAQSIPAQPKKAPAEKPAVPKPVAPKPSTTPSTTPPSKAAGLR